MTFTDEMFALFNQNSRLTAVEAFNRTHKVSGAYQITGGYIHCADGFALSIQASDFHYCLPRQSFFDPNSNENFYENYHAFEIGYPNEEEELLLPYADDEENPTDTVYPYVPKEIINLVVEKHGGVVRIIDGTLDSVAIDSPKLLIGEDNE